MQQQIPQIHDEETKVEERGEASGEDGSLLGGSTKESTPEIRWQFVDCIVWVPFCHYSLRCGLAADHKA